MEMTNDKAQISAAEHSVILCNGITELHVAEQTSLTLAEAHVSGDESAVPYSNENDGNKALTFA